MKQIRHRETDRVVRADEVPVRIASWEVGPPGPACFTIELTHHDPPKWALRRPARLCWNRKLGEWVCEPSSSSRDDRFFKECRFDTAEEAFRIAQEQVLLDLSLACRLLDIGGDETSSLVIEEPGGKGG